MTDIRQPVVFGVPRHTALPTYTGGDWETEWPASNLALDDIARVARSASLATADTQFVATFPKRYPVRLMGLVGHNLTINALWRIRFYDDTGLTDLVYDTGWIDVWPVVYPLSQTLWSSPQWWTGKYTRAELMNTRWTAIRWLTRAYRARAIKVEFDDPNNPDGYVQAGLFEIAQAWQASINFAPGSQFGLLSNTKRQQALGGTVYKERRRSKRVFRGSIDFLPHDEAMSKALELLRQYDTDIPFLFLPDPDSPRHWVREAGMVTNVDPGLFAHGLAGEDRVPIIVEEV
jgi:hypothetical protein